MNFLGYFKEQADMFSLNLGVGKTVETSKSKLKVSNRKIPTSSLQSHSGKKTKGKYLYNQ